MVRATSKGQLLTEASLLLKALTDGVVHALVDGRAHKAFLFAYHTHFSYLKCCEVAKTKLNELALLVHLIDRLESFGKLDID